MPAYVIADITVKDRERYQDYVRQVPATLEPYGGRSSSAAAQWRWQRATGGLSGS